MTMQQYCLRWNNHQPNFISVFSSLLNNESLVDVTLAAEGRHLQAHKVVLSACSSYFQSLFTINPCQHPIVILKDVKFLDLKVMVDFMYYGEVNVSQEQLPHILKTAEMLKIKGLADIPVDQSALTKSHNSSTDRAELLTPGDSNWSSDEIQRHSLSPSPCPLSPASKRKRLRKTSTGSGSGSAERTSEDHPHSEVTLTSPGGSTLATVIKADPGAFTSENSTPIRSKQHSSESELHRGSSHESVDCDPPLQITLQVPQQDTSHNLDSQAPLEIAGPSAVPQQNSGYQWGVVDGNYPRFAALTPCQPHVTLPTEINYAPASNLSQCSDSNTPTSVDDTLTSTINTDHIANSPPSSQKRKRSINPQADENFVRALEAVRFGGIGFCKAAKMYGVNNRTLWLEYKKRGYPNHRISIKNRKQEFINPPSLLRAPESPVPVPPVSEVKNQMICSNPDSGIVAGNYIDSRHVDLTPFLQRHLDTVNVNAQQPLGLSAVSFEHM
ncbi:protein bric-a-brac 1-like isoform X3 [Photinus pyralis]|nr:protein bric-a-brac 1-like isoform X3 [Photinus pyralis]